MTIDRNNIALNSTNQAHSNGMISPAPNTDFLTTLKSTFGLQQFRKGQQEIITATFQNHDVLAVLPTGSGKSLCFQFTAVFKQQLVIVVSPLIALMRDQVSSLKRLGIPAGCLHSGQSEAEKRDVFRDISKGGAFLLYLSPERVQKEGFQSWILGKQIALFAIDEAHCVSQWGHDFREEYAQLEILKKLRPDVPILALTASATPLVLDDIARHLSLKKSKRMVHGFYRPNLYYQVENCKDEDEKSLFLKSALQTTPTGRKIIYCGTRKKTEELSEFLSRDFEGVGFYHAGLSTEERTRVQESYANGHLSILVATNAFGMGIDQPDVKLVVHFQLPANIDSLYQEMGRAGRDNKESNCLLLYAKADKGLQNFFIMNSNASKEIKNNRWRNLEALVNYAEGGECRHGEILTYYKDSQRIHNCGHCDVCSPSSSRKILRPEILTTSNAIATRSISKSAQLKQKANIYNEPLDEIQEERFQRLRSWRKQKALELDMPAFVIFSDQTLRALAQQNPQSLESLKNIYGIGQSKLEKFGWDLLAELQM